MKQIAAEANVSIPTVSKVLRGKEDVASHTRERVLAMAKRLKYRPNLLVRGIQTGQTQTLGVMVPLGNSFYDSMIKSIHDRMIASRYVPMVLHANMDPQGNWIGPTELELIHELVDRRIDGLILTPVNDEASDQYFREILDHDIPLVVVDRQLPQALFCSFVGTDDQMGGQLAAEHLLSLGHRHLGHLAGPTFVSTARDRQAGFEDAIKGVTGVQYRVINNPLFCGGIEEARQLLAGPHRPTAIFAANDYLAVSVCHVAEQMGLRIPDDLSVIGFADLSFAQWLSVPLTTLRQPTHEIGCCAVDMILEEIKTKAQRPKEAQKNLAEKSEDSREKLSGVQKVLFEPELVIRQTTAKPRVLKKQ